MNRSTMITRWIGLAWMTFAIAAFAAFAAPAESAEVAKAKPANYEEIKKLLESYARADDFLGEKLIEARKTMHSKGVEAVPALLILFEEDSDDYYRQRIVSALIANKGAKNDSVAFFVKQLEGDTRDWKGESWVASAIKLLASADQTAALGVSRKALDSQSDYIKSAAVESLDALGEERDIELLRKLIEKRKAQYPNVNLDNEGLVRAAKAAMEKIAARGAAKGRK